MLWECWDDIWTCCVSALFSLYKMHIVWKDWCFLIPSYSVTLLSKIIEKISLVLKVVTVLPTGYVTLWGGTVMELVAIR